MNTKQASGWGEGPSRLFNADVILEIANYHKRVTLATSDAPHFWTYEEISLPNVGLRTLYSRYSRLTAKEPRPYTSCKVVNLLTDMVNLLAIFFTARRYSSLARYMLRPCVTLLSVRCPSQADVITDKMSS